MLNRRQFTYLSAAACLAGQATTTLARNQEPYQLAVFAKPLQELSFAELGKRLKSINAQGIEATLRRGGQIEPKDFSKLLGKLVDELARFDQKVLIATTNINRVNDDTVRQLEQFAKFGIRHFRMDYYRYDLSKPILAQLEDFTKQAVELSKICKQLGVRALYQNHAGNRYMGAALWDLLDALKESDPEGLRLAFDIRHTSVELSQSWPAAVSAMLPFIGAIFVKDFQWTKNKAENVALGAGVSTELLRFLVDKRVISSEMPISLHVEYLDHRKPELLEKRWSAIASDMRKLKKLLNV